MDVTMPIMDGWEALARIRDMAKTPVIMLTAKTSELEKVRGLKSGADDYIAKPFGKQELLARVEAVLRRGSPQEEIPNIYNDGLIEIDFQNKSVRAGKEDISLTPTEFRLLSILIRHPNQVLSREQLLELVWGSAYGSSRDQVKLYIGYLRRKLGEDASVAVETVRGFGYRYNATKTNR
jgi:DNA-binding response OmpR family regulator